MLEQVDAILLRLAHGFFWNHHLNTIFHKSFYMLPTSQTVPEATEIQLYTSLPGSLQYEFVVNSFQLKFLIFTMFYSFYHKDQ